MYGLKVKLFGKNDIARLNSFDWNFPLMFEFEIFLQEFRFKQTFPRF